MTAGWNGAPVLSAGVPTRVAVLELWCQSSPGVPMGVAWFREQRRWKDSGYLPQPGEIIFFDWNEDGIPDHVGIVEKVDGGVIYTIEGNSAGDRCRGNRYAMGNELLAPDEVRMLDNQYALLFIRGERPIMDLKYNILRHPFIGYTTDGGAKPFLHGEDTRNIAALQCTPELLEKAGKLSLRIENCNLLLLTEEELEEYLKNNGGIAT